ncbi:rRNA methyltransferase 1, mitochondrial isoform 1-T1 [Ammospiza maritima maritima]
MERALLPLLCPRALRLCRAPLRFRSSRGAEQGAPRGGDPPEASGAGRGSRTGRELWRAQQDSPRAGTGKGLGRKAPPALARTKGSEIVFGVAPCWLALARARRALFRLFLKEQRGGPGRPLRAELALQAAARGVPVLHVPGRALDTLCRGRPHQGVCLEAAPLPFRSLRDAEERDGESGERQLLWLVLEHIQDPMNLGALLRSAYFLGVDRVVATRSNSCPLTPIVSKASAGTMEVFDVYSTDDLPAFLKAKSAEGWEVVGTASRPEDVEGVPVISCSEFRWDKPLIVVIDPAAVPADVGHPPWQGAAPRHRLPQRLCGCRYPPALHLQPETEAWRLKSSLFVEEAAQCGYGNALPRVSTITVTSRESPET